MKHLTNFYRVPDTGLTYGLCSCGWSLTGQRDEVEARAATHDLDEKPMTERPLAAEGLISYRCRNRYGWTMIGAKDDDDALREARRSWDPGAEKQHLEVWDGLRYVPVALPFKSGLPEDRR